MSEAPLLQERQEFRDTIARLLAEIQRLRKAMERSVDMVDRASTPDREASDVLVAIRNVAREALAGDTE